jgi:hypothetical protein
VDRRLTAHFRPDILSRFKRPVSLSLVREQTVRSRPISGQNNAGHIERLELGRFQTGGLRARLKAKLPFLQEAATLGNPHSGIPWQRRGVNFRRSCTMARLGASGVLNKATKC